MRRSWYHWVWLQHSWQDIFQKMTIQRCMYGGKLTSMVNRPRGKESTKLWITQKMKRKGKLILKNEEISEGKAHTNTQKLEIFRWSQMSLIRWESIPSFPSPFLSCNPPWWHISKLMWCHLYCVFTYNYSLLIEKDICDHRNISNNFLCVCVCLSSRDLFNYQ